MLAASFKGAPYINVHLIDTDLYSDDDIKSKNISFHLQSAVELNQDASSKSECEFTYRTPEAEWEVFSDPDSDDDAIGIVDSRNDHIIYKLPFRYKVITLPQKTKE